MAAGTVLAGSGMPDSVHVTQTSPLTVSASGTWTWPEMATATPLSYTGFAIDWGDVTSGNAVGTYHIGDGTAATNLVMQPTSPAQGASGSWGPATHTYVQAGTYKVCVILYDLGEETPFKATGYHGLRAGGIDYNTDNSVDTKQEVPALCSTVDVTDRTPVRSSRSRARPQPDIDTVPVVPGRDRNPLATPPPTSASSTTGAPDPSLPLLPLALLIGSVLSSAFVFRMERIRR